MAAGIGEKLRLEREARGIALRDISEQTRISMRYLEAIETDDFRRLPGGIFNRSFIRAYAKFIGFDEEEAIEEYARTLRERGEGGDDVSTKPFRARVYTDEGVHNRSPLMTLLLAIIILAILSLCVWAGLHLYQRTIGRRSRSDTGWRIDFGQSSVCAMSYTKGRASQLIIKEGQHDFTV